MNLRQSADKQYERMAIADPLIYPHEALVGRVHSCRADPIKRSTRPFCQGERKDVGRSRIPIARTRALNAAPNARSLSRTRYFGAVSHGNASVIWRATHSAVGLRVTANHNNCRRLWPRTR